MSYHFTTTLETSFENAIETVTKALKEEGFGVLTEIDVKATFKKKLDVEYPRYQILGACNPEFAYQALQKEEKIGTMLPCNVIVQDNEDGTVDISAVDPMSSMQAVENRELGEIAEQVQQRLQKIIESL